MNRAGRPGCLRLAVIASAAAGLLLAACSGDGGSGADNVSVETVAGSGEAGYIDGNLREARFTGPEGLAVAADGTVFVAETLQNRIRAISPDGIVSTFVDGDEVGLRAPHRMAVGPSGDLFVTDTGNHRVVRVTRSGEITVVAGGAGRGFADGPGRAALFDFPLGIAVDDAGVIYVVDTGNKRIRRIAGDGLVSTLAGDGEPGYRDGEASQARFDSLNEIAVGGDGTVYVSELDFHRIRAIARDGRVSTVVGLAGRGSRDGPLDRGQLVGPGGLSFSAQGTLLIADTFGHRIRELRLGDSISTVAGDGEAGLRDGAGDRARFFRPIAIDVAPDGSVWVADAANHAVRRITR